MSKKYSGKILIYVEPRWNAQGGRSGEGCWEIEFNHVPVTQFKKVLEGYLADLKSLPERDAKGRFVSPPPPQENSKEKI